MGEVNIWSQDGPEDEIEIRCIKAIEKFWNIDVKQMVIEVHALHPDNDIPFSMAAVYEDPNRTREIARILIKEALPRLRYCSMLFYKEAYIKDIEGLLSRERFKKEFQTYQEWAKQKTFEKLPTAIKEKVEKGKELKMLLDMWIFCYAQDQDIIYILDAYDSQYEVIMLMNFLEVKANRLGKLLGFKLEKRTDIGIFNIDDEEDAIYTKVYIKSTA